MNIPTITMKLRVSAKEDFFDLSNKPLYGTMYFIKSGVSGAFDNQPYYLTESTDKVSFNEYFKNQQVYVPVRLFDKVELTGTNN